MKQYAFYRHISCILIFFTASLVYSQNKTVKTIAGKNISINDLECYIKYQMDTLHIPGLSIAIIDNRSVAYAKNWGVKNLDTQEPVNENTIFEACSLSKPIFAYFVIKLAHRGVLNINRPLYSYYMDEEVDYSNSLYKQLTARMILTHCSGWPNWRDNSDEPLVFRFKPGTQFGYSGEGYQYLKRILVHQLNTTDSTLDNYFDEEVYVPLQTKMMSFIWHDSLSKYKAFGHRAGKPTDNWVHGKADQFDSAAGLHSTAFDYAKFLIEVMDTNKPVNNELLTLQTDLPSEPDGNYRSLAFPYKEIHGKQRFYHSGNNGDTRSYCHFYPNEGAGIVLFSNCDNLFSSGFVKNLLEFLDEEYPY
ncbi:hypothetical protein MASR1M31_16500 [Porphyromonadaceae bacterium]